MTCIWFLLAHSVRFSSPARAGSQCLHIQHAHGRHGTTVEFTTYDFQSKPQKSLTNLSVAHESCATPRPTGIGSAGTVTTTSGSRACSDTPAQFVTDSALFHRGLMIDQKEQAFCLQLEDSELAHALGSAPGIRSKGLDELHRIVVQLHPHPFNIIRRDFEIKQAVPKAFATAYMWVL